MKTKTTLPVSSARKKIFSIMKDIQKPGAYYTLTDRGIPKAVILSSERFEKLTASGSNNERGIFEEKMSAYAGSFISDGSMKKYAKSRPRIVSNFSISRDGADFLFSPTDSEEEMRYKEEGYIKATLFVQLIDKHDYPLEYMELGRYVQRSGQSGKRYIEADMIVGDRNGDIKVIFEVSPFDDYEKNMDSVVSDLYDIAEAVSWRKKPEHLVYYSRSVRNGNIMEKIAVIDYGRFPSFASWKKGGRIFSNKIPKLEY